MKLIETEIAGAFEIELPFSEDDRGDFVKILHEDTFLQHGLQANFAESYYSTSKSGVVRGMHFQSPPHDHEKLVYAVDGKVIDVLLDLRSDSATFKQSCSLELSKEKHNAIYIPKGVAHGFCVPNGSATLVYMTSTVYNQDADTGVLWDSFGFSWPIESPQLSERDRSFAAMDEFDSPF